MHITTCPSHGAVWVIVPFYFSPVPIYRDGAYDLTIAPADLSTLDIGESNPNYPVGEQYNPISGGRVPGGGLVDYTHINDFQPGAVMPTPYLMTHSELLGSEQILHGFKIKNTFVSTEYGGRARGIFPMLAFNGPNAVEPGQLGVLTWDLPTWAAVDGELVFDEDLGEAVVKPGQQTYQFGGIVTAVDEWKVVTVPIPSKIPYSFGALYTLAGDRESKRLFIGAGPTYSMGPIEAGADYATHSVPEDLNFPDPSDLGDIFNL